MTGTKKPKRDEAFDTNMADAELLLRMSSATQNQRLRRARVELRNRVGEALRIPMRDRGEIHCVESDDLFIVIKPGSTSSSEDFDDPRPLLRQALVAGCAATETFLNDLTMDYISQVTKVSHKASTNRPKALRDIVMNVDQWLLIELHYQRRRRGLREVVLREYIGDNASTAPNKVGHLMSLLGITQWAHKLDSQRKVTKGNSVEFLDAVTKRRNLIAHTGDRKGNGRAAITAAEVDIYLSGLRSIAEGLDSIVSSHFS